METCLKRKHTTANFIEWAVILQNYLEGKGISFAENGLPIIPHKCYLEDIPAECDMLPISKGWHAKDKSRTILCSFERDQDLYRHIRNLISGIQNPKKNHLERIFRFYKQFYAVCGFDLSVCENSDIHEQEMVILLNHLINAVLAVNNIRLIANFRIGSMQTIHLLSSYPKNVVYAVGTLGCFGNHLHGLGEILCRIRLMILQPKFLLIYGSTNEFYRQLLTQENTFHRQFQDYRKRTWNSKKEVI